MSQQDPTKIDSTSNARYKFLSEVNRDFPVIVKQIVCLRSWLGVMQLNGNEEAISKIVDSIRSLRDEIGKLLKPYILTYSIPSTFSVDGSILSQLSSENLDWLAEATALELSLKFERRLMIDPEFEPYLTDKYIKFGMIDALRDGFDADRFRLFARPGRHAKFFTTGSPEDSEG